METSQFEHKGVHFLLQSMGSRIRTIQKVEDILSSNRLVARFTRDLVCMPGYRKVSVRVDDYSIGSVVYFFTETAMEEKSFVSIGFDIEGDYSDTLVIKNMVTHPEKLRGTGIGKMVLSDLLIKAVEEKEIKRIIATQVQYNAEGFWKKCGFRQIEGSNTTNDFEYIR